MMEDNAFSKISQKYPLYMHDFGLHDPFIYADRTSGLYYLYNASNCTNSDYASRSTEELGEYMDRSDGVYCWTSPDLMHWSEPTLVFNLHDRSAGQKTWYTDQQGPWAPEVHQWHGSYWMFVTLHNPTRQIGQPWRGPQWYLDQHADSPCTSRGVFILHADSPAGPFVPVHADRPTPDPQRMTLDGTLAIDADGSPWMIYAHEWVQMFDGTMEAIRLDPDDLATAVDSAHPRVLWEASQGPWHPDDGDAPAGGWKGHLEKATVNGYVTDGPFVVRTNAGALLCLWTSYSRGIYTLTQAISRSGHVPGPWEQLDPLLRNDCGHAMVFRDFDGQLHVLMHTNMTRSTTLPSGERKPLLSHGALYRISADEDGFHLLEHESELDGMADPANDDPANDVPHDVSRETFVS
jgi:hypothetical protein